MAGKRATQQQLIVVARERRPLNDMERAFVQNVAVLGMTAIKAAAAAGYAPTNSDRLLKRLEIVEAIGDLKEETARRLNITRDKITDGILGAIDRARMLGEPSTEIMGWRDLAKMCGYDVPDVKNKPLSEAQRRLVEKFEAMSDEQILALLAEPTGRILEHEEPEHGQGNERLAKS